MIDISKGSCNNCIVEHKWFDKPITKKTRHIRFVVGAHEFELCGNCFEKLKEQINKI